ncbi:MAG: topoisomerase C-terminal repeat-containing protein [bacterium]
MRRWRRACSRGCDAPGGPGAAQPARSLGLHPESGKPVQAGIGRYRPYIACDGVYASLRKEDDVLRVGGPRAGAAGGQKGVARRRSPCGPSASTPRTGRPWWCWTAATGRMWHKVNASLPEGMGVEDVSMAQAVELLAARAQRAGGGRKAKARAAKPKAESAAAKPKARAAKPKAAAAKPKAAAAKPKAAAAKPKAAAAKPKAAAAKPRATTARAAAAKPKADAATPKVRAAKPKPSAPSPEA